jgi:hypothetical protein
MADGIFSQRSWKIGSLVLFVMLSGILALFLMLADPSPKATVTVSGRITYQGKPLSSGIVLLVPNKGHAVTGIITDGQYKIDNIALGPARIAVLPDPPAP